MHKSAGAVIKVGDKFLLIDRRTEPFGFAGPAGHIEEGEDPYQALVREVKEETGLTVTKAKLLLEEMVDWNECRHGTKGHYWYLYNCEASGELEANVREAKSVGWYTADQINTMKLEPVWKHWFTKLKII